MDTENMDSAEQPATEVEAQDEVEFAEPDEQSIGIGWLLAAGFALIAVPVLVGFIFLTGGDNSSDSDDSSSDMAGGMGGDIGGGVTVGVANFAEIQASDLFITPDGSGSGAILRVTTEIDVACAVAYGRTNTLGSLATDTDMAGGGHTDHAPVMTGLEPGVDYYYRLSGTGPDGRLYQSELRTFTFEPGEVSEPTSPAAPPPAPNVALFANVADVSSEFSSDFGARYAIDGDLSTEWSSAGDGDDAFIELDFGETMAIEGVGFRTREMSDGTSITNSFTVTVDGTTFGPFDAGPGLAVELVRVTGQVVRFDVETSTGGNTGAVEVEVYGATDM